jgi:uncharacterized protein YndB with AHSA1/START domain
VTGQAERVVLQDGVGGRIYERAHDGVEHEWGEVTVWEPPSRLAYLWHIGRGRAEATEVEIHFLPQGPSTTRVEIEHRGWERLGVVGDERRSQNQGGWQGLIPRFQAAVQQGDGQ